MIGNVERYNGGVPTIFNKMSQSGIENECNEKIVEMLK